MLNNLPNETNEIRKPTDPAYTARIRQATDAEQGRRSPLHSSAA